MEFEIAGVAVITVLCYLAGVAVKLSPIDDKWIPVICGALGGLLGIAAMHLTTGFPAQDDITAAAIGVVSGLAATGADQIRKQLGSSRPSGSVSA